MNEIAKKVGASKSSVSLWVRDMQLTAAQRDRLRIRMIGGGHSGRLKGAEWNKQQRLERIAVLEKQASKDILNLSLRELFFLGLGLYWGEGFKARSTANAGFSNSDHRVVVLMIVWLEQCLGISRERLHLQVFINSIHRYREKVILKYWKTVTGLPQSQFLKVIFLEKGRKVYENQETYYGVCAVRVLKGSELKNRIIALIQRSFDLHEQCRRSSGS